MHFELASSTPVALTGVEDGVYEVYKDTEYGVELIFAPQANPIYTASIVFPTEPWDDKGHPHCLEHLLFMGSKTVPNKYLEKLVLRSFSAGSNAYTYNDHTCYYFDVASADGLSSALGCFVDHLLNPLLADEAFTTEVYHVTGEAKAAGVVYCEMAGRENTESDLLEQAMNGALFPGTGYAFENGGKTPEIALLTNEDIMRYHAEVYTPERMKIIIQGPPMADKTAIFDALAKVDYARAAARATTLPAPWTADLGDFTESVSRTLSFPAQDEEVGSISYGWRGPDVTDTETLMALDVLMRYLQGTAASPLRRRFSARNLSSDVSYALEMFKRPCLVIYFSGVPTGNDAPSDEDGSDDGSASGSDDGSYDEDASGDEDEDEDEDASDAATADVHDPNADLADFVDTEGEDLFAGDVYLAKLRELLSSMVDSGKLLGRAGIMRKTVQRHRLKHVEDLEDDVAETVRNLIIPETIWPGMTRGEWTRDLDVLAELEKRPDTYWLGLIKTYLLDAPHVEIKMKPSSAMAEDISARDVQAQEARREAIGEERLAELGAEVERAIAWTKADLDEKIKDEMPPLPPASSVARIADATSLRWLAGPACLAQLVPVPSEFSYVRICMDTAGVDRRLRPYLSLLQELLFRTRVEEPGRAVRSYTSVSQALSEDTVYVSASVGTSGGSFSCGTQHNMFQMIGSAQPADFEKLVDWFFRLLRFTTFPAFRVRAVARNMLADLAETRRDGFDVNSCITTLLAEHNRVHENEAALSIFAQGTFLKKILDDLKAGKDADVDADMRLLCRQLLAGRKLVQVSARKRLIESHLDTLSARWPADATAAASEAPPAADATAAQLAERLPFSLRDFTANATVVPARNVLVPISGVDSGAVQFTIPCRLDKRDADYYPLLVLAALFGQMGTIRDNGLAYGGGVSFYPWSGQLCLAIWEAAAPAKAFGVFAEFVRELADIHEYDMDNAKAEIVYQMASSDSTSFRFANTCLRSLLQGFTSVSDQRAVEERLFAVTPADVLRVRDSIMSRFLSPAERLLVVTANPSQTETIVAGFAELDIAMEVHELDTFDQGGANFPPEMVMS